VNLPKKCDFFFSFMSNSFLCIFLNIVHRTACIACAGVFIVLYCTYLQSCFDYSRCAQDRVRKVYVYPPRSGVDWIIGDMLQFKE
jgi:hypothetical protein